MKIQFLPFINYRLFLIFSSLCFGLCTVTYAQNAKQINIVYLNEIPAFKLNERKLRSLPAEECKQKIRTSYLKKGYLEISIDSSQTIKNSTTFFIHAGKKYKLKSIEAHPDKFTSMSKQFIFPQKLNPQLIQKLDSQILAQSINKGYPYAQFSKDIYFNNNFASLNYHVNSGYFLKFDSIKTTPNNLISYNYLSKLTGIEAGKPYNKKALKNLPKRINQSSLFLFDTVYVSLSQKQAQVHLRLKKISLNTFSGLVGIQSNEENKTEVTGNASIALANAFKKGEEIKLEWKKPGNESQQLETSVTLPYIFKLPVGVNFYGNLDKQDSTFTNTQFKFGLMLPSKYYGDLSLNAKWLSSSVNSSTLPNYNSGTSTLYGLGFEYSLFDNPIVPKKGIHMHLEAYLGNNKLINTQENSTNTVFELTGSLTFALPLPIGSVYSSSHGAIIINDSIKTNNLYRIGGVNSIRGFNENSIYTQSHTFNNLEYRLYLNAASFIYSLYDFGFFNEAANKNFTLTFRQAVGIGLSFKTKGGNLKIAYAIGKSGSNSFELNQGKIHIGYINHF